MAAIDPSPQAIDAAAQTEAVEVNRAMGQTVPKLWRERSEEDKAHWRRHVGAAVRAAYEVDFGISDDEPRHFLRARLTNHRITLEQALARIDGEPDARTAGHARPLHRG